MRTTSQAVARFGAVLRDKNNERMEKADVGLHVAALRTWMQEKGYAAFVVPLTDPHNSEYISDHWKSVGWLSGFTGSAALAVVTMDEALLWTDSRYWLQAGEQLADTPFSLMRDGAEGVPSPEEWLKKKYPAGRAQGEDRPVVSAYAETMVHNYLVEAQGEAAGCGFRLQPSMEDPFDSIWTGRPRPGNGPVEIQPIAYCGLTITEKVKMLREKLSEMGYGDYDFLVTDLSEIAWLTNLRGYDIPYNPVFTAYLWIYPDGKGHLCLKSWDDYRDYGVYLRHENIDPVAYKEGPRLILEREQHFHYRLAAADTVNCKLATEAKELLGDDFITIPSPVTAMMAVKTEAEQNGFRRAMEKDGTALVNFLSNYYTVSFPTFCNERTEMNTDRELTARRKEEKGFLGLSFGTIAAYGPHGAIVHYEADETTNVKVEGHSFLLLDSGAHYVEGTTDITRTLPCGTLTDEERLVYTLVLKGHIGLSSLRFPEGTVGLELDLAARRPIWEAGYDFGHGTGHGVGSRLCVHEGPHQIRKNVRACTTIGFYPGMTVTDEPGIYVEGKFGVRIENTLLVVPDGETPYGRFCRFEPLTLCPIDLSPVQWELITPQEKAWLNDYHAMVWQRLSPLLKTNRARKWLEEACAPV